MNNSSISNAKYTNSSIIFDGQTMSLGASYTTPLLAITNGMLSGNISISKLANGTIGQIIIVIQLH